MSSLSQYVVVVWEKFDEGWTPYSPAVTQNLERAFHKKLTRININDIEVETASLDSAEIFVNMRTMQQVVQCSDDILLPPSLNVRRKFYKCESPAGKGIKWEWNENGIWKSYNMEIQQEIENAWTRGAKNVDLGKTYLKLPFSINFLNLTQVSENRVVKCVRRVQQAPYPKLSVKNEPAAMYLDMERQWRQSQTLPAKTRIVAPPKPPPPPPAKPKAKAQAPGNIARQILNLVSKSSAGKFGHKSDERKSERQPRSRVRESDSSSVKSNRRPSVDTVSTYLSHESRSSRRSNGMGSVSDLLDCSIDDDVFAQPHEMPSGQIVGIDKASNNLARFVKVVEAPDKPTGSSPLVCPMCLDELRLTSAYPTVCLVRCQHYLHLNCLNELIIGQQDERQKSLYIECPLCLTIYGEKVGDQPADGTMTWFKAESGFIQIVYNFRSGIQGPEHPNPGRQYFAVGFPRKHLLPDTPMGRKVLRFLKVAFDRRLLFSIGCSATTGIEDIILSNKVDLKSNQDPNYLERVQQQLVHLGVAD